MNNPIALIKKLWRGGMISLVVATMVFGGLFLNIKSASAGNPNLTLTYLGVNNSPGHDWSESVSVDKSGQVAFYAEIHNTNVPSTAQNVHVKATLPGGTFTDSVSTATVSAGNANTVNKNVSLHINGGGQLQYVPGSTKMTWDVNGDGNYEYKDTVMPDGIFGNGLVLGNQNGCNNYIIQISWKANVVAEPTPSPSPSPSPTPTPTPVVSPSPSASPTIVINNNQEQKQEQNNNQTVNITTGQVAGAKVPAKTPDTGVSVLGMISMLGAGPTGFALTRFGRGRVISAKKEETLSETATRLFGERNDA